VQHMADQMHSPTSSTSWSGARVKRNRRRQACHCRSAKACRAQNRVAHRAVAAVLRASVCKMPIQWAADVCGRMIRRGSRATIRSIARCPVRLHHPTTSALNRGKGGPTTPRARSAYNLWS